jgi:hypothetical protein
VQYAHDRADHLGPKVSAAAMSLIEWGEQQEVSSGVTASTCNPALRASPRNFWRLQSSGSEVSPRTKRLPRSGESANVNLSGVITGHVVPSRSSRDGRPRLGSHGRPMCARSPAEECTSPCRSPSIGAHSRNKPVAAIRLRCSRSHELPSPRTAEGQILVTSATPMSKNARTSSSGSM